MGLIPSIHNVQQFSSQNASADSDKNSLEKQEKDYLRLFMAQLQNQNPLDPMDPKEMNIGMMEMTKFRRDIKNAEIMDKNAKLQEVAIFNSAYNNLLLQAIYNNLSITDEQGDMDMHYEQKLAIESKLNEYKKAADNIMSKLDISTLTLEL